MRKQWWSPKVWVQPASTRIYTGHRFGGKKQLATVAVQLWFISRTIWSSSSQSIWSQLTYCILLYGLVIHNIYIYVYIWDIYIYMYYIVYLWIMRFWNCRCYAAWFPVAIPVARLWIWSSQKTSDVSLWGQGVGVEVEHDEFIQDIKKTGTNRPLWILVSTFEKI